MNRITIPVEGSQNIKAIVYDHDTSTMQIDFHRGSYLYLDVPKQIFLGMWEAPSKGKYFQEFIKDQFESKKGSLFE